MSRTEEIEKVKQIIKEWSPKARCGIFNAHNWCGDLTINVFSGEYFQIDICYGYAYFEVFGTTDKEWAELYEFYMEVIKNDYKNDNTR